MGGLKFSSQFKRNLNLLKLTINIMSKELFQSSLICYLILLVLETIKSGFVTFFFNINILLLICLISGLFAVVTEDQEKKEESRKTMTQRVWHYFFRNIRHREQEDKKWKELFREMRTNESGKKYQPKPLDEDILTKDIYKWIQQKLPSFYYFRYFSLSDRDWHTFKQQLKSRVSQKDLQLILLLSLGGGLLVYYKTKELGIISFFTSLIATIIIILLSYLILSEKNDD